MHPSHRPAQMKTWARARHLSLWWVEIARCSRRCSRHCESSFYSLVVQMRCVPARSERRVIEKVLRSRASRPADVDVRIKDKEDLCVAPVVWKGAAPRREIRSMSLSPLSPSTYVSGQDVWMYLTWLEGIKPSHKSKAARVGRFG